MQSHQLFFSHAMNTEPMYFGTEPQRELHKNALETIKRHLDSKEKDIYESLVAVDRSYRILCEHKKTLKVASQSKQIDELEQICETFFQKIIDTDKVEAIDPNTLERLAVFVQQAEAYLRNNDIWFVQDLFIYIARREFYFLDPLEKKGDLDGQTKMFAYLFQLHFRRNAIFVSDEMIEKFLALEAQDEKKSDVPQKKLDLNCYFMSRIVLTMLV